jgi:hypothetical protein
MTDPQGRPPPPSLISPGPKTSALEMLDRSLPPFSGWGLLARAG